MSDPPPEPLNYERPYRDVARRRPYTPADWFVAALYLLGAVMLAAMIAYAARILFWT